MKKILFTLAVLASSAFAHSAIMNCFDNADGTVTCEGGFSDGSSSSGVAFVIEQNGKTIFETKMSENGDATCKKPSGDYTVILDAGEGHEVYIKSKDISK